MPTLQIKIAIPNCTPKIDSIFLTSSRDNWSGGSIDCAEAVQSLDGYHYITLSGIPGECISFKLTRGSWNSVETKKSGQPIANRTYMFSEASQNFDLIVENWKDCGPLFLEHTKSGQVHEIESFQSHHFEQGFKIQIYLPQGYDCGNEKYPVLYMQDGQNLFDSQTSTLNIEWQVDETLERLIASKETQGAIVVGIFSSGFERESIYVPWLWEDDGKEIIGLGDKYLDFLTTELKPYIDKTYRTLIDKEFTGIAGSSLGGLIAFYGGIKHQNIFGVIGAFSPSFWVNHENSDRNIFTYLESTKIHGNNKIYIDVGIHETPAEDWGDNIMVSNVLRMRDILSTLMNENNLKVVVDSLGFHTEDSWCKRFPDAYLWMFKNQ